ncbi:MAG: hypothetical protein CL916_02670 [Deltaproteobacteria bacterium]|nr:hypothetical protein [Deltaproteobacteria bacterium]
MIMVIELLCLLLAVWAAKLSLYSPPVFDWKESFVFSLFQKKMPTEIKIYPPCLGSTWDSFDAESVQKRHQALLSHVVCFSFSQNKRTDRIQDYFKTSVHIVSLDVEQIAKYVSHSSQRILFVCEKEEIQGLLKLLQQHPGMRDVLYGVVCLDPMFDYEWMDSNFDQDILDTEANRPVPYIFGFSQVDSPIPVPRESKTGWKSITTLSLGSIDTEHPNIPMALGALFSALNS